MIGLATVALAEDPARLEVLDDVSLELHGFLDVGWFDATGSGASYRFARTRERDGVWVYTGDPWAAAINSQGEAADLGNAFNNLQRADRIASGGRPTFVLNTLEQAIELEGDTVGAEAALWVEPGPGDLGDLADAISLDRAFVTWRPEAPRGLSVEAGKVESPFGLEWYHRRAPDRVSITPSLVARYTTGTPIGLKGTLALPRDGLELTAAVTNGGAMTERFGHLEEQLDRNGIPSGTARVRYSPWARVDLGASAQVGAQDGQERAIPMVQVGADLAVRGRGWGLDAEYLLSDQDGGDPADVDTLFAHGGYLLAWGWMKPWFAPHARVDRRFADLSVASVGNLYRTDVVRLTVGVRLDLTHNLIAKAEVLHPWELRGLEIDDDVYTTSVVFRY